MSNTETAVRTSPVTFTGQTRFHLGVVVTDLQASIDFYEKVFDCAPLKVRTDYAKFEPSEPSVNFTLNLSDRADTKNSTLSHFGIQLKDTGRLAQERARLDAYSMIDHDEIETSCCYARQDKFWVKDPDGHMVEFFVVLERDAEPSEEKSSVCCVSSENETSEPRSACCPG